MTASLRYPSEVNKDGGSDYMIFQAHEYRTNKKFAGQGPNAGGSSNQGAPVGSPVILYMPNSTPAVGQQNSWQDRSFGGPLGQLIGGVGVGLAASVNALGTDDTSINGIVDGFKEQLQSVRDKSIPALKQFGIEAIGAATAGSGNNLIAIQKGQIYNPNVELLYQGPTLRAFDFNFNLIPKSEQESQTINKIILEFKKWSSPLKKGDMLEVPKIWSIKYMMASGQENDNMNKFKRCALLGVTIQANASSNMHQTFTDGMPIVTALSLKFQEVDIITREDHEEGGNQGF